MKFAVWLAQVVGVVALGVIGLGLPLVVVLGAGRFVGWVVRKVWL